MATGDDTTRPEVRDFVTMNFPDRACPLLGEVRRLASEPDGKVRLDVTFFSGEPWPLRPERSEVKVLLRRL